MKVEKDYEELLKLFNKERARYCIIGAYAVAFYAKPRYTKDMDILIDPTLKNAKRILKALNKFGFRRSNLSLTDFSQKGKVIQLGYEPVRVDILTSIEGVTFKSIWKNKARGTYGNTHVFFIGLNELIRNKKASKRKQDDADLDILLLARKKLKGCS